MSFFLLHDQLSSLDQHRSVPDSIEIGTRPCYLKIKTLHTGMQGSVFHLPSCHVGDDKIERTRAAKFTGTMEQAIARIGDNGENIR